MGAGKFRLCRRRAGPGGGGQGAVDAYPGGFGRRRGFGRAGPQVRQGFCVVGREDVLAGSFVEKHRVEIDHVEAVADGEAGESRQFPVIGPHHRDVDFFGGVRAGPGVLAVERVQRFEQRGELAGAAYFFIGGRDGRIDGDDEPGARGNYQPGPLGVYQRAVGDYVLAQLKVFGGGRKEAAETGGQERLAALPVYVFQVREKNFELLRLGVVQRKFGRVTCAHYATKVAARGKHGAEFYGEGFQGFLPVGQFPRVELHVVGIQAHEM